MADAPVDQETVEEALDELVERSDVLVRARHPDGNPRWLSEAGEGVRWLAPSEGRDHVQPWDGTAATLRHYDAVTVVDQEDAPERVQRAVGGWFGMAGTG